MVRGLLEILTRKENLAVIELLSLTIPLLACMYRNETRLAGKTKKILHNLAIDFLILCVYTCTDNIATLQDAATCR